MIQFNILSIKPLQNTHQSPQSEALYESLQDDDDYLLLYDSDEAGTTEESSEEGAEPLKYRLYEVKR